MKPKEDVAVNTTQVLQWIPMAWVNFSKPVWGSTGLGEQNTGLETNKWNPSCVRGASSPQPRSWAAPLWTQKWELPQGHPVFTTLENKQLTQSPHSTALDFQSALRPAREPHRFVLLMPQMPHPGPSRCHRGHFSVTHQPTVSRSFTLEPPVLSTDTCWEHKTIRGSQRTRRDHDGCSHSLPVLTYTTQRNAGHTMPTPHPPLSWEARG